MPTAPAQKQPNSAIQPEIRPDFRHITDWVFDLDHTLYTADEACHTAVEQRICQFVQRHLGLAKEPAFEIQKRYLREMGSTLSGLAKFHGVDIEAYHDYVNDLDELQLKADPHLRQAIARLPGRKLVFTNNCGRFATQVLATLGIGDLFTDIVDAKALNHAPKPMPEAYALLVARTGLMPRRAALFDDSTRNLLPAHALGMTTVWVNAASPWAKQGLHAADTSHIHHEITDLSAFLHSIRT